MQLFKQSEATASRRRFYVFLVDATDGLTPETGEAAGQPQVSKNGGSYANTTNTLVAIGNGAYYVELTATELNNVGFINVRYKSANTAEFNLGGQVVTFDPYDATALGLSRLDAAITTRMATFTLPTNFSAMGIEADGHVHADLKEWKGAAPAGLADTDKVAVSLQHGATDVITSDLLAASAVNEIRDAITGYAGPLNTDAGGSVRIVDGTGSGELDTASGRVQLTEAQIDQIVDELWDEALAGHTAAGSAGERLGRIPNAAAGGAGGLGTVDANNRIAGIAGTKNTLDDLADLSAAAVNAELVDVLTVDTLAELGVGQPPANPTFAQAFMLLYMRARNAFDLTSSSGEEQIYNDAGTAIAKKTLADDGTTYTETKMVSA